MTPHPYAERRTDLGLTRPELARRLGVSARTVKAWERGERRPCPTALDRWHEVLDGEAASQATVAWVTEWIHTERPKQLARWRPLLGPSADNLSEGEREALLAIRRAVAREAELEALSAEQAEWMAFHYRRTDGAGTFLSPEPQRWTDQRYAARSIASRCPSYV